MKNKTSGKEQKQKYKAHVRVLKLLKINHFINIVCKEVYSLQHYDDGDSGEGGSKG
jgi:hypothetical protein